MNLDLLEAFVAAAADLTAMFAARASGSVTPTASTQPPTPSGAHGPQVKTVRRHPHPAHEEGYIASIKPLFNARQIPLLASFDRAAAALTRVSRQALLCRPRRSVLRTDRKRRAIDAK